MVARGMRSSAGVAQRQSSCFVNSRPAVRIRPPAPEIRFETHSVEGGFRRWQAIPPQPLPQPRFYDPSSALLYPNQLAPWLATGTKGHIHPVHRIAREFGDRVRVVERRGDLIVAENRHHDRKGD